MHAALADLHGSVAPERLLQPLERHGGDAGEVRIGCCPSLPRGRRPLHWRSPESWCRLGRYSDEALERRDA